MSLLISNPTDYDFNGGITKMPAFVCDFCNCLENTALSYYWCRKDGEPALCSACDPTINRWHNRFERVKWDGNPMDIINRD